MDHHFPRPVTVTSSKDDDSKDTIGDDSYSTEGWCISNRGWLATVTFSTLGSHQVKIFDDAYKKEVTGIKKGGTITIELRAALNQDWNAKDYGWVEILSEKARR